MRSITLLMVSTLFFGCSTAQFGSSYKKSESRNPASTNYPCEFLWGSGPVQIIPLDGSNNVIGSVGGIEKLFGTKMNPVMAEPSEDGSVINFVVYETVIPSKIGQKIAEVGTLRFLKGKPLPEGPLCPVQWDQGGQTRKLVLVNTSPLGDLILSDIHAGGGSMGPDAPTLIIKHASPRE